jgi:DnaJ-class molecular chaperone
MSTHYDTLGISKDANETEIKKAYRSLSFKHHPDRDSSETAHQKMQEINTAYEVLKDESARREYDDELNGIRRGFQGHGFPGHGFPPGFPPGFGFSGMGPDLGSIFEMFLNGGGPGIEIIHGNGGPNIIFQRHISKPQAINKTIEISLETAYAGANAQIEIQKMTQRGDLQVIETETIHFNIPKGICDGEVIVLNDCGNTINDTIKGDVKIIVVIKNETAFVRSGQDLIFKKNLSLKESLCGFTFQITHLNGKIFGINNSTTVIPPGSKKVINSMGMMKDGQPAGNLIIEFEIDFPTSLTPEQKNGIALLLE